MIYLINKQQLLFEATNPTPVSPSTAAANVFKKFNRNEQNEQNTASTITEAVHVNHPYLNKQSDGNQGYSRDEIRLNRKRLAKSILDERQDGRIERRLEHSKMIKDPVLQAEAGAAANVHFNNARSMSASGGSTIDRAGNVHKEIGALASKHNTANHIDTSKVNNKQSLSYSPRIIPSAKQ